jgi:hypothetical protein
MTISTNCAGSFPAGEVGARRQTLTLRGGMSTAHPVTGLARFAPCLGYPDTNKYGASRGMQGVGDREAAAPLATEPVRTGDSYRLRNHHATGRCPIVSLTYWLRTLVALRATLSAPRDLSI